MAEKKIDIFPIADWMLVNNATSRQAGVEFGYSHSAINYCVEHDLRTKDRTKYDAIKEMQANRIGRRTGTITTRDGKKPKRKANDKCNPPEPLYIALEDLDFSFYKSEIDITILMWTEGNPLGEIAEKIKRDADEVAILLMDLARKKRIPERNLGALGY